MTPTQGLRVTLLAEYYLPRLGGVEVFVSDLAAALARRGHRVRVITTTPPAAGGSGTRIPTAVGTGPATDVEVVRVPCWHVPALGVPLSPKLPARLKAVLAASPPDVVHVHASIASAGALSGGWAAASLGLPTVATLHSVLGSYAWVHRLAHGLTGWGRWPHVMAGVAPGVALEVGRVLERPTSVLPNGVDVAWWRQGPPPDEPREPRCLRLVAVQRLKARKRGAALLAVLARVQRGLPAGHSVRLTMVGEGPRRAALEEKARKLGLRVRFTGALSRAGVRATLAASDVFVLASKEESFGLAAVEARAAGLPIVTFRTGHLPEIADQGRCGILVDGDHGLEAAVLRLATDASHLARLGAASRALPPPFDWDRVVGLHEGAYHEAIELRAERDRHLGG